MSEEPRIAASFPARPTVAGPAVWLSRHLHALLSTVGELVRSPLATTMAVLVIGVALALPAGVQVVLDNLAQITEGWQGAARLSLYLEAGLENAEAQALAERLEQRPEVEAVTLVTPAEALAQYQRMVGVEGLEDMLGGQNPLPAILDLTPSPAYANRTALEGLAGALGALPDVALVEVDLEWVSRLEALLALLDRALWVLGGFLALAVVLVIGNTLRQAIDARREEIEIVRTFGGTNAFVRRPFLYGGALLGAAGGVTGWCLVLVAVAILRGPVAQLAALYGSEYLLALPGPALLLALAVAGAALGLAGAYLAVGRHLGTTAVP